MIAIIGILVALLLPAVQGVREAARRLQCANNFRQVGLALHNYHSTYSTFPQGTTDHPSPNYEGWAWPVRLLPFIEQNNAFDRVDWLDDGFSGSTNSSNRELMSSVVVDAFTCPSSPCPKLSYGNNSRNPVLHIGSMVGIAGAVPPSGVSDTRYDSSGATWAVHAWNGVLFAHSTIRRAHIRDGTSNVACVGETSDWGHHPADPTREYDCRGMFPHGFWIGADRQAPKTPARDLRVFNTTVINTRPLGTKVCDGGYAGSGVNGTNFDNQVPIQSAHPGGAHLLLCDGSVHFFSETMEFEILKLLAIRDSGQVKAWK